MKSLDIRPKRIPKAKSIARQSVPFPPVEPVPRVGKRKKISEAPKRSAGAEPVFSSDFGGKRHFRKSIVGAGGIGILVILVLVFVVLPEARIKVTARTEATTRDLDLRVDQNQSEVDSAVLAVPGRILEQEREGNNTYPATGKKNVGKTASGFVFIYNFSKNTLILRAKTTVLSVDGKKYYFTQDAANIRPTAFIGLEDQEVDPSSLVPPIPVIAETPGEGYNLAAGNRLEIDNEVFGHQPQSLYAVVAEDISGGSTKEIKVVTTGDVTTALSTLANDIVLQAREELIAQNQDLRLIDSAFTSEVLDQAVSVPVGTESDKFQAAVKIKLRALVYNEADVRSIITERIKRLLPENKVLTDSPPRVQADYAALNLDQGFGILKIHYEGQIVYKVDLAEFAARLRNKSADEIREILLSRPEIAGAEVKFYPAWVKKAPRLGKRIDIQIQ